MKKWGWMTNYKITLVLQTISRYRNRLRDGLPGIDSRQVQDIFLFSTASNGLAAHPAFYPVTYIGKVAGK
jgi:hypothetical protein